MEVAFDRQRLENPADSPAQCPFFKGQWLPADALGTHSGGNRCVFPALGSRVRH